MAETETPAHRSGTTGLHPDVVSATLDRQTVDDGLRLPTACSRATGGIFGLLAGLEGISFMSELDDSIQLKPGVHWSSADELNRIARQQGLCLAIAQASVFDEICQAVQLPHEDQQQLTLSYLAQQGVSDDEGLHNFLAKKGWDQDDAIYFATKGERINQFKQQVFQEEVELRFLSSKLDRDEVIYSLIRVQDENLAFELHQQLQEGEASFEDLASQYSEGPEKTTGGRLGPYPLSQAHDVVAEKLRVSQPGQLWPPFFLVNIWLILRLDHWEGARLDSEARQVLLDELFQEWLNTRVMQLLQGETPSPLPTHLLKTT